MRFEEAMREFRSIDTQNKRDYRKIFCTIFCKWRTPQESYTNECSADRCRLNTISCKVDLADGEFLNWLLEKRQMLNNLINRVQVDNEKREALLNLQCYPLDNKDKPAGERYNF